ncbi:MAG: hypothetical protein ACE5J1_05990 [Nitrospiria bacterium]
MHHKGKRSIGRLLIVGIGWTFLVIIVGSIVVYFSWNMAMPELFGAARMSFKNAFGLVLLASMASWIIGHGVFGRLHLRRRMWKEKMWKEMRDKKDHDLSDHDPSDDT